LKISRIPGDFGNFGAWAMIRPTPRDIVAGMSPKRHTGYGVADTRHQIARRHQRVIEAVEYFARPPTPPAPPPGPLIVFPVPDLPTEKRPLAA
jgi:hypothetical protein